MMKRLRTILLPAVALIASTTAHAANVAVDGDFLGGVFGNFNISYGSGDPGVKLQQLTVELKSPLFTDPTWNPPGMLLPFAAPLFGSAQTGFLGASGVVDGANSFTLFFSDFEVGETFNFELDVDSTCTGFLCEIAASWVTGQEFAGSTLTATFGGAGYETTDLSAIFAKTGPLSAKAQIAGDVNPVPEPGTVGLLAAGLGALVVGARKRAAKANS